MSRLYIFLITIHIAFCVEAQGIGLPPVGDTPSPNSCRTNPVRRFPGKVEHIGLEGKRFHYIVKADKWLYIGAHKGAYVVNLQDRSIQKLPFLENEEIRGVFYSEKKQSVLINGTRQDQVYVSSSLGSAQMSDWHKIAFPKFAEQLTLPSGQVVTIESSLDRVIYDLAGNLYAHFGGNTWGKLEKNANPGQYTHNFKRLLGEPGGISGKKASVIALGGSQDKPIIFSGGQSANERVVFGVYNLEDPAEKMIGLLSIKSRQSACGSVWRGAADGSFISTSSKRPRGQNY